MYHILTHREEKRFGDELFCVNADGSAAGWYPVRKSSDGSLWLEGDMPVRRKISGYANAIQCIKEYCRSRPDSTMIGVFRKWCEDRLNPAKRDFIK